MTLVPISQICQINPITQSKCAENPEQLVDFISTQSLHADDILPTNISRPLRDVPRAYSIFADGDVVITMNAGEQNQFRPVLIENLKHSLGAGPPNLTVLRPCPLINPRYLYHLMQSSAFRAAAQRCLPKNRILTQLPDSIFEIIEIPLPELRHQSRISGILDAAQSIDQKRRRSLQLLPKLPATIFQRLFGRSPHETWASLPLGDLLASAQQGLTRKRDQCGTQKPFALVQSTSLSQISDINLRDLQRTDASPDELQQFTIRAGDLLLTSRIPGSDSPCCVMAPATLNEPLLFSHQITRIYLKPSVDPFFLQHLLQTAVAKHHIARLTHGSTVINENLIDRLHAVPVPLPPLQLQQRFANTIQRLQHWKHLCVSSRGTSSALYESLLNRSFDGLL